MESRRTKEEIKKIIIHSSASSYGNAAIIDSWHRESPRNWDSIGYHYVIPNGFLTEDLYDPMFDGNIESGRHWAIQGAHCKGQNNDSIGICLIGNPGSYSTSQLKSLGLLIDRLSGEFTEAEVHFHSEFNEDKPNCPGLTALELVKYISNA